VGRRVDALRARRLPGTPIAAFVKQLRCRDEFYDVAPDVHKKQLAFADSIRYIAGY
jgi:hypothetical protein